MWVIAWKMLAVVFVLMLSIDARLVCQKMLVIASLSENRVWRVRKLAPMQSVPFVKSIRTNLLVQNWHWWMKIGTLQRALVFLHARTHDAKFTSTMHRKPNPKKWCFTAKCIGMNRHLLFSTTNSFASTHAPLPPRSCVCNASWSSTFEVEFSCSCFFVVVLLSLHASFWGLAKNFKVSSPSFLFAWSSSMSPVSSLLLLSLQMSYREVAKIRNVTFHRCFHSDTTRYAQIKNAFLATQHVEQLKHEPSSLVIILTWSIKCLDVNILKSIGGALFFTFFYWQ